MRFSILLTLFFSLPVYLFSLTSPFTDQIYYLEHVEGRGLGYHKGYTTLGAFTTFHKNTWKALDPFMDVKIHYFNNGKMAANAGAGVRFSSPHSWIFGAQGWYDFRQGRFGDFHQIGVGLEALGPLFDFRVNGYFPVGNTIHHSRTHVFDSFVGDYWATCQEIETAWRGLMIEWGLYLRKRPCNNYDLYLSAGPYYFKSHHTHAEIYGGKIRLDAAYSYFNAALIGFYDQKNKGRIQLQLTVWFPWNKSSVQKKDCCQNPLIFQPMKRQEIIYLSEGCNWDWNW